MTSFKIVIESSAETEFRAIPFPFRRQINQRVARLNDDSRPADAELISEEEKYRLRVHGWRVLYEIDDVRRLVTVWAFLKD